MYYESLQFELLFMTDREALRKRMGQDVRPIRLMSLLPGLLLVFSDDLSSSMATLHRTGCPPHRLA